VGRLPELVAEADEDALASILAGEAAALANATEATATATAPFMMGIVCDRKRLEKLDGK